ncbi:MAG: hydantoinase/oxoprolinase family protein, partial [Rhodanobacter sp.]
VDLIEIGAGGGSIARVDDMQLLKVGPGSAGSEPGPACYNLGGTDATVTDADLVLGYLNPDYFAGGSIRIDIGRAEKALSELGSTLRLTAQDVARGIHDIVAENMAGAARVHVAERGHDPRDFVMVCTGGGGPLYAYSVARKIGVRTIVCPASAGVASAVGLLVSPARVDRSRTVGWRPDIDALVTLEDTFASLEADAFASLKPLMDSFGPAVATRHADGRFIGQGFTLTVELPDGPYAGAEADTAATQQRLVQAFESAYRDKFGRTPPDVPVELVNLRATVSAMPRQMFVPETLLACGPVKEKSRRDVYFAEVASYVSTPVYARATLPAGAVLNGPLLIEDAGSTLVIGPSGRVEQRSSGNIVITISEVTKMGNATLGQAAACTN